MLALCFMLWHAYYAQNYASIIDAGLPIANNGKYNGKSCQSRKEAVSCDRYCPSWLAVWHD